VEARRAELKADRRAELDAAFEGDPPGRMIVVLSWVATVVLLVLTVLAAVAPDEVIGVFFGFAMGSFLVGSALFALDVVLAASRSREASMGIGGLFFLAGSAPRRIGLNLNASLAVSVVVVLVGASVRPFTPLAFGVLAPVLQLACSGLWGVLHGHFPPRGEAGEGSLR
jgi:hypothetical protein